MKLLIASGNDGKVREFKTLLRPFGFGEVCSLKTAGIVSEPEENGDTFEENALIKARAAHEACGLPVIADDSGLEVDALGGAPGIYSARYAPAGEQCSKLLSELSGVPEKDRTARFVCVICYIDENSEETLFRGEVEGHIGSEERGENGFGYDPVFMYGEKSFAELSDEEKNRTSHRAAALAKLAAHLERRGRA